MCRRDRQCPAGGRDRRARREFDCGPLHRRRHRRNGSSGQDRRDRLSLHRRRRPTLRKLDADDLLQGGPAVSIEGDVSKGIILAVPPKDNSTTDNDEDDDGIEDSKEGSAAIASYGSAAALRIGSAGAITIGATEGTGTGFGLIIDGSIFGDGLYAGVDGNALQIGGMGGTVSIANGIGVTGTVQAKSLDKAATAVRLGAGASTPELRNAGKILASSGNDRRARSQLRSTSAPAQTCRCSATAVRSSRRPATGRNAVAIVDKSGTL